MSNHTFTVRLDTGYDEEKAGMGEAKKLQRKTHLSYNRIVTDAVNAYETDFVHLAPEDETRLIQRITDAVAERLQQILPAYLAGYWLGQLPRLQSRLFLKWKPKIKQSTPNTRKPMKLTMISAEA